MQELRLVPSLLLFAFFYVVAAAGFLGYIEKWPLEEQSPRNGFELVLDGSAHKPFIFRQLLPIGAGLASAIIPPSVQERLVDAMLQTRAHASAESLPSVELQFKYLVFCAATFAALLASLFALRYMILIAGGERLPAVIAPAALVLAMPYLQTYGAYYYDSVEILCLSLAIILALKGRIWMLAALALVATLNKETFFLFLPALYPFLRTSLSGRRAAQGLLSALLPSIAVNAVIRMMFQDNAGEHAEFHLIDNLLKYFNPLSYTRFEETYGMVGPEGLSILSIGVILLVFWRGWNVVTIPIRQHAAIAAIISVPLCILFALAGELRNFSFTFPALVLFAAFNLGERHRPGNELSR